MKHCVLFAACALSLSACSSGDDDVADTAVASAATGAVPTTTEGSTPTTTGSLSVSENDLTALVTNWVASSGAPGAIVGVRVGTDDPVIVAAGGDAKTGAPLSIDASFSIASITKTFVGGLALDLVDAGVMSLNDPLARYLPEYPQADVITIRHLLQHTSGIPPLDREGAPPYPYAGEFESLVLDNLERRFTPGEILAVVRDRPLLFEPGTGIAYSNVNTIVLGEAIAAATGEDIVTALRTRLLEPLRLEHTYFGGVETGAPISPGLFTLEEGGPLLNTSDFATTGLLTAEGAAGALISTPHDLLVWSDAFFRAGAHGDTDVSNSRFEVTPDGIGLGVIVRSEDGRSCVFDNGCTDDPPLTAVMGVGSNPGTISALAYFPASDLTILAIANSSEVDVDDLVNAILEEVVPANPTD